MNATKKLLVGRRIVDFQPRLFSDGRGGWAHDPVIVLDNGALLVFVTEETESQTYGTAVVYRRPDKEK